MFIFPKYVYYADDDNVSNYPKLQSICPKCQRHCIKCFALHLFSDLLVLICVRSAFITDSSLTPSLILSPLPESLPVPLILISVGFVDHFTADRNTFLTLVIAPLTFL